MLQNKKKFSLLVLGLVLQSCVRSDGPFPAISAGVSTHVPVPPSEIPAQENPPHSELRILTLNVFLGDTKGMDLQRLDLQIKKVKALDPDIVCLQEVYDPEVAKRYAKVFENYWTVGIQSQSTGLKARLYAGAFRLRSERAKATVLGNKVGLMMLVRKGPELTPLQVNGAIFSDQVSTNWLIRESETIKPRGYSALKVDWNGHLVWLTNMILSNGPENPERIKQVMELENEIGKRARADNSSVILCGDSNADGEQPEMKWLRDTAGYVDSFLEKNPDPSLTPHQGMTWSQDNPLTKGLLEESDQRVDLILLKSSRANEFQAVSSSIVLDNAPFVSDHFGVMATIRLNE